MNVESAHAYRFEYLKSDQWKSVRLEALAREKGKCQICGLESIFNDAHHIWYPENIYDTKENQLVVLCRPCHDFLHTMLPDCKTRDEEFGRSQWIKFRNAIEHWRLEKMALFDRPTEGFVRMRELGKAYDNLKSKIAEQHSTIQKYEQLLGYKPELRAAPFNKSEDAQIKWILKCIKKWARAYSDSVKSENEFVDDDKSEE